MLKALYDYGIRNNLAIAPGFTPKAIRAYINISLNGDFIDIEKCENESQICPDIGSLANGPDKCNPLAEKAEIILAVSPQKTSDETPKENDVKAIKKQQNNIVKKAFFHAMLKSSSEYSPLHAVCLKALENPDCFSAICDRAKKLKLKAADRISFKVDSTPITDASGVKEWWSDYRTQFYKSYGTSENGNTICLITGKSTSPLATLPTVNGLQTVGGHSRGEALFCFDKNAFCSYGLKQSANAPVSEEAFSVVKDALNDLLKGSPAMYDRDKNRDFNPTAPVFSGMKFVHWYDKKIEPQYDTLMQTLRDSKNDEEMDSFGGNNDVDEEDEEGKPVLDETEISNTARNFADKLIESVKSGIKNPSLPYEYHILLISGANGRAMIRRYEPGSYESLQKNLNLWNDDLSLCDNLGTGMIKPQSLWVRFTRLMSRQKSDKNPSERMKKELAGITPSIIMAIINGTPLPDSVAARALAYIKSTMLDPDENNRYGYLPDGIACQWLKVCLMRKRRMRDEEVLLMPFYDSKFPNMAYHCGAITAIYADIQNKAMPGVNAGIVQRYYASASRTPSLVLGTLERMSKFHLDKITNPVLVRIYESHLNEAYAFFGKDEFHKLPSALNLEEQSYFALGYRQMCACLEKERKDALAKKETTECKIQPKKEEA